MKITLGTIALTSFVIVILAIFDDWDDSIPYGFALLCVTSFICLFISLKKDKKQFWE